ncbi:Hint domain-containing protein [Stigmatella hybrida]|uniref:Hint domain-containing protein n=1 Tax=Stigmatella hybrida TaxID=394097 RepID=UPI001CDA9E99|nr:Hint domain-containing protein [Stigmatella hybrida]
MRIGPLNPWEPLVRASQMMGVLLFTAGWSGPLRPPSDRVPHPQLVEQSRRMNALYDAQRLQHGGRRSIDLDLSDDAQHAFVLDRLQAAGKTARNAPGLFHKLSQFRAHALRRARQATPAVTVTNGSSWCDHSLVVKPPAASNTGASLTYEPYVRVSCQGGAAYVYADLLVHDINREDTEGRVVASQAGEEYGGGTGFTGVGTVASVDVAPGRLLRLESLSLAMDEATGREFISYTVEKTSLALKEVGGVTLLHPRETVPNNTRADIWMCQLRGGSDCDYAVAGYDQGLLQPSPPVPQGVAASRTEAPGELNPGDLWEFSRPFDATRPYVPLRVEIQAGSLNGQPCTVDHYTHAQVRLHAPTGEACVSAGDLTRLLPVGQHTAVFNHLADVSYNLQGQRAPECSTSGILHQPVHLTFTLAGMARCTQPDGAHTLEPFYRSQAIDARSTTAQRLLFQNSCMAEGTRIQLANGRVLPVEQIETGDKVLANRMGLILTVTDVIRGNETQDFVQLQDTAGHSVTLTQMHPILKADGRVVAARALRVRDQVLTDKGAAMLKSVKRVPVHGKRVFNLALGTPYELRGVGAQERTLFASGFVVGDKSMQELLLLPPLKPTDVMSRLPKVLHEDFANAKEP